MEAKDAAYTLYQQGFAQKEIATLLKRSEQTISKWAKENNWEEKRTEQKLFEQTAGEKVQRLISYQLKVLESITDKMEKDVEQCDDIGELQKLLIGKGDIDALQKLFLTIKNKEMQWEQKVSVIREFTEYLEQEDTSLARKVAPLASEFLNEKRKEA